MSKRRRIDLDRKWRLHKLLADYKEHKLRKKSLGYLREQPMRRCRAKKCDHDYVPKGEKQLTLFGIDLKIHKCSKCGKEIYKNV